MEERAWPGCSSLSAACLKLVSPPASALSTGSVTLTWTAGFLVCIVLSMYFLELAARTLPPGTAYAVWTDIGALGIGAIEMIWFSEPATIARGLLVAGLVGCIAGLKLTSGH